MRIAKSLSTLAVLGAFFLSVAPAFSDDYENYPRRWRADRTPPDQEAGFGLTLGGFNSFDQQFSQIYGTPITFSGKLRWIHQSGFGIEGEIGYIGATGTPNTSVSNANTYYERGDASNFSSDYRFYSVSYDPSYTYAPGWQQVSTSIQAWPILFSVRQNFNYWGLISPYVGVGVGIIPFVEEFSGYYYESGSHYDANGNVTSLANDGYTTMDHNDTAFEGHAFAGLEFFTNRITHLYIEARVSTAPKLSGTLQNPADVTEPGAAALSPRAINLGGLSLRMGLDFMF